MSLVRYIPGDLLQVFKASYTAVLPQHIVRKHVQYDKYTDTLQVTGKKIPLADKKLYMVGAGKGVQYLAKEIDKLMGPRIEKGIVSIPEGSLDPDTTSYRIDYREGAKDNLPDKNAESTAKLIKELASSLTCDNVLLVLITGGGSALLPLPIEPITLEEKTQLIKKLANSGADITELNIVRKRLSAIKGGKLANCSASRIITMIISDIVDDPFDLIASGPTVQNTDDPQMAIDVLQQYNLYDALPKSIKEVLDKEGDSANIPSAKFQNFREDSNVNSNNEQENDSNKELPTAQVLNFLLASNRMSINEAKQQLNLLNAAHIKSNQGCYFPIIISRSVTGNVKDVALKYYKLTQLFGDYLRENLEYDTLCSSVKKIDIRGVQIERDFKKLCDKSTKEKTICLILAGETTVEVKGTGKGGRNQQLPLEFSKVLHKYKEHLEHLNVYMLSAGTDGIDGPTDAAGAIGHINLFSESMEAGIDVNKYIDNNDSYTFYKTFNNGMYHIKTGHTNTNVMDIHLIAIELREKSS
ncbi:putative Glycerate kinase [Operophtera brumata]|uniref:Glycerate kinase n=1 Tax=Operophtera brumata TaxID=104452 RepID=A0A0L7LHV0_OPEBR|nr:putative Glycerate kinase [Operophtera brumata]